MSESKTEVNEDMFEEDALDTLKREAIAVAMKVKYTVLLLPGDREEAINHLKNWDLWGPLLICLIFALGIGLEANSQYTYDSFVNVFIIFWLGAALAGINCRLLGNKGPIFQSISIIGYCMIPIALIGLIIAVIPNSTPAAVKLVLIILALAWSTISCMLIMRDFVDESKKILCAYPVLLFYIFLSWYAIVS